MMSHHHSQKKLNFQGTHTIPLVFSQERSKKKTVNNLEITEAPRLCTQEIHLSRRMSERIEVFLSTYILA